MSGRVSQHSKHAEAEETRFSLRGKHTTKGSVPKESKPSVTRSLSCKVADFVLNAKPYL